MLYSSEELLGNVLGGCSLERLLGQGGMGAVYLARQERPSRHVAVKVLLPDILMTSQMQEHYLARFRREADIIARLEHVNIVPIYAYGEQDGLAYLVMPYLQGGSLYDVLERRGQLSLDETINYLREAAAGLDYAHAHEIIHRDLKPANFLLHSDGRLLLSDFGIARVMQEEMSTAGGALTVAGTLLGTPYYMSPEMLRGEKVDHRADLYALGVIIYQLLSGQPPFLGETPYTIIAGHMQEQPPSLHQLNPTIPSEVDTVVQKALAKNPKDRYQTASALVGALTAATLASPGASVIDLDAATIISSGAARPGSFVSKVDVQVQRKSETRLIEERKLVSVLYADAMEATTFDEMLDPEDVRALMERYNEHVRRVATDHGGLLQQFAGDAVVVFFGLPQAHGDDAERVCAAALALRRAMASDQVLCDRLQLQQGINTGEIVATSNPSTGNYDVKGEVVHAVTRLQQAAPSNEILVGERTVQAARSAFKFGEERQIEMRGRKQPLRAFPLAQEREFRQIGRPPLVGRRQDLLQLELLKARALEDQRPQLVSIIGPAGIGKSRLLEEFLPKADQTDGVQYSTALCLPYGQSLVYSPLRGLLAGLLGSKIDKPQVIDVFVRGGYTLEHASNQAEWIMTSLNMEEEESTNREAIFSAWRLLIELFANQAPCIVIFEDLHWASDSLIDLVEHIMHPRTQAPLLIIVLSRPELLERRPTWGGGRQNFIMLTLEPLTAVQTQELVGKLMSELSPTMRKRVAERSGGNPFFAIELIQVLAEHGTTSKDSAELDILPDTVHAAVLAQLDRLSPQEHRIIQTASVVGQNFSSKTIHAVLNDLQHGEVDAALDALFLSNLIVLIEEGNYAFRHALIREVAYGTLSRTERIKLHGTIISSLQPLSTENADEYLVLLAYHYREAVQLARQSAVPIELPSELTRALNSWRRRDRGQWLDLDF
jgi:class 3 adenylate cyclase/tRNA A-37 threonylcarbamoyl transferase component Bud32